MKFQLVKLLILISVIVCSCNKNHDKIIGIKIYDYHGDYVKLADKWTEMGINTAFVGSSLAACDTLRQVLRKRAIAVYLIFPVFQNPEVLKTDSSLFAITAKGLKAKDDWVNFVCPSREAYRKSKIAELSGLIRTLKPDGVSIDFIRQFVFWEMVYPDTAPGSIDRACYCDTCLVRFSARTGITVPDSVKNTALIAKWLDAHYSDAWNGFRCDLITSMVKELSQTAREIQPGIKINFHAVPWMEEDFGHALKNVACQEIQKIEPYVDYISPMCYSQMLKRDAVWVSDVVAYMNTRAPGKIIPSIQVYPYYIDRQFTVNDFRECTGKALQNPSCGIIFFSWPLFEKDPARMEVVSQFTGRKTGI